MRTTFGIKALLVIAALTLQAGAANVSELQRALYGIDWTGTAAVRRGDFSTALKQILIEPSVDDSLFRDFKLAVIYYRLHNYSTALSLLRSIIERQPALSPIIYVYIAEIELELGRTGNTLAAYRSVLRDEITQRYRHYIYEKLRNVVEADSSLTMEQAPWLEEYYRWLAPLKKVEAASNIDTIEGYIKEAKWALVDSIISDYPPTGKDACRIVKSIRASLDEDSISIITLYWCARTARSCGELTLARQFLDMVEKRPGLADSLSVRQYRYFRAQLHYDRQEWDKAIRDYKRYLKNYGQDADVLLAIARAYRKLNKQKESGDWYDRLMKVFPRNPITQDIIWLRAWNYEDAGRFDLAAQQYRLIIKKYTKGSRLDEAYLRQGLCYFKRNMYDSARAVLDTFVNKLPDSRHVLAGYFWQAKCYLAVNEHSDAVTILRLVSRKEPFHYYAHRSRRLLTELGEAVEVLIDTNYSGAGMVRWFDSVAQASSERKELSSNDSTVFLNGIFLASIGDIEKANLFLEPLELGFPGNLSLQYKLAMLYIFVGATPEAFRIARRLTWRIPPEFRAEMPLDVYRLFYPPFYADQIIKEAKRYNLDPYLISGLIRQESIFNPEIVSPAGAIGLMQIMPYTGKYIAEKKRKVFAADSLYLPQYNIHFGTYYLHELQEEFDTNFVLMLAAYNAGPHNAKKWAEQNKNDEFDLFIEDIGFTETRNYVKKVMANYWTYCFLSRNTVYAYGTELPERKN